MYISTSLQPASGILAILTTDAHMDTFQSNIADARSTGKILFVFPIKELHIATRQV